MSSIPGVKIGPPVVTPNITPEKVVTTLNDRSVKLKDRSQQLYCDAEVLYDAGYTGVAEAVKNRAGALNQRSEKDARIADKVAAGMESTNDGSTPPTPSAATGDGNVSGSSGNGKDPGVEGF